MALLQTAFKTFEAHANEAGAIIEGQEPLVPIAHIIQTSHIEITLSADGGFISAKPVPKDDAKTIIPVTISSANRTSAADAHPLCDYLSYLMPIDMKKHEDYLSKLRSWASSGYSHQKVRTVLKYMEAQTLIDDLASEGLIELDEESGKIKGNSYEKQFVRWRINGEIGERTACWEDKSLFDCYTGFYLSQLKEKDTEICLVSGEEDIQCDTHPKGVVSSSYGAKLISTNDMSGFTFRGRFTSPEEAVNIGYISSQKAHNALRWIAANQGVIIGGRTFICWNPNGAEVPSELLFGFPSEEEISDFASYKNELLKTLGGYEMALKGESVVIAVFDAATTGRLSVTYYNELEGSDLLGRIQNWYETFCWGAYEKIQTPPLRQIVSCAFGNERGNFIEVDVKIMREHVQRLLSCIVDKSPIPTDIVHALANKASTPLAYSESNRNRVLITACAAIRKHHNDKLNREEWKLALDRNNHDRSYLWGRLLACADMVEKETYEKGEERDTNAIKMQAVFSRRPAYAWQIISESLNSYFTKLRKKKPARYAFYNREIDEILNEFEAGDRDLNDPLDFLYILGLSHQRSDFYKKKGNIIDSNEEDK